MLFRHHWHLLCFFFALLTIGERVKLASAADDVKKIVVIAGALDKGHPRGTHEYERSAALLKHCLDTSPNLRGVRTELHFGGWPEDPTTLEDADTIVVLSNGSDRRAEDHPLLAGDRLQVLARQMNRGCGLVCIHWTTFFPKEKAGEQILEWIGGYFDYESGPPAGKWFSKIQHAKTNPFPGTPDHPICRGMTPFELREEYYYNLRFRERDPRLKPILKTAIPNESQEQVVAWAVERKEGGRGFGFTGGHYFDNWQVDNFRRMVLNAIAWTAKAEVPKEGVQSKHPTDEELARVTVGKPIKAVIVTGHQYPGHKWELTTPALVEALRRFDPRFEVTVVRDVEYLASPGLRDFPVMVFNYCNWERPGLSDAAKAGFVDYLRNGGGLVLIHFSNGAFHFSLPKASESDWPEYRKICRRVWDHSPDEKTKQMKSGHDAFGKFQVNIADDKHPITAGLLAFETTDELYFNQQGEEPIHVVATAKSKITGRDEPMAFVYEYGKGRVFQTVLGHAEESIRASGAAELITRGTAWAARRNPAAPRPREAKSATADRKPQSAVVAGKFGQALNANGARAEVPHRAELNGPSLTVECCAKLNSKDAFNILVAKNPKESAQHWELFTMAGAGTFTVYIPGYAPDHVRSDVNLVDGQWHYVAMTLEEKRVRLHVDGKQVADQEVQKKREGGPDGPLWFGAYPPGNIGCDGAIDEVRVTSGSRPCDQIPTAPFTADDKTIGLWHFDATDDEGRWPDASPHKAHALRMKLAVQNPPSSLAVATQGTGKILGHWGEDAIGFRWTESDSADGRWNQMDTGRFFSGTIGSPAGITMKGLCVRVGDDQSAAVCYDTELLRMSVGWTGKFLAFDPARFGLISPPRIAGQMQFASPSLPGWTAEKNFVDSRSPRYGPLPREQAHYRGLYRHGERVVLHYTVGKTDVFESPWLEQHAGAMAITRTLQISAHDVPLRMLIANGDARIALREISETKRTNTTDQSSRSQELTLARESVDGREFWTLTVSPSSKKLRVKVLVSAGVAKGDEGDKSFQTLVARSGEPEYLQPFLEPGPEQWGKPLKTRGVVAKNDQAYVVDTLTLPFDNPHHALMFCGGHDFFSNGNAAVCTVHGDVWLVSGIDDKLERLTWKRFATGLFQPLGVRIVRDELFVLGRDQITRLHDRNGDGEADYYENFNNGGHVTANGHEYVTCLESDRAGNFYYLKGDSGGATSHDGSVLRVSADGKQLDLFATGFRNANGASMGPEDTLTVAPQEGNWTPASAIFLAKQNGFYGHVPAAHRPSPPTDYERPLCWLPRRLDNSSGGQAWVPSDHWGPLSGQLLHLSYGTCRLMLVPREEVAGQWQGGTVLFPLTFESGAMRARFHPRDGQLYVTGLKGWTTSGAKDGCFQRVRYTGRPVDLPVAVKTMRNGLAVTFARQLEKTLAEDPDSYSLEQWNYLWSANYGSPELKPSSPNQEGRDEVPLRSATLLPDGRTVFLEIPDLKPVMMLGLTYDLAAADDSAPIRNTLHYTINRVGDELMDESALTRRPRAGQLAEEVEQNLKPGLWHESTVKGALGSSFHRATVTRLASLKLASDEPSQTETSRLGQSFVVSGFVRVPMRGDYQFVMSQRGVATRSLEVNGKVVSRGEPVSVRLHKGFNRLTITGESDNSNGVFFRLLWTDGNFPLEPLPPTALFHDGRVTDSSAAELSERGQALLAEQHCLRCHSLPSGKDQKLAQRTAFQPEPPDLIDVASRLDPIWLAAWLQNPADLRERPHMPRLFNTSLESDRQQLADVIAYLTRSSGKPTAPPADNPPVESAVRHGEVLFEDLGCIACHHFGTGKSEENTTRRTSLHFTAKKFLPDQLENFLRQPHQHFPWSAMPDFHLNDSEASALSAFIRSNAPGTIEPIPDLPLGDPTRGKEAFVKIGCAHCHRAEERDTLPKLFAMPGRRALEKSDTGCLSSSPLPRNLSHSHIPQYGFSDSQRRAIQFFLEAATKEAELLPETSADVAENLMQRLNCTACHSRDAAPAQLPNLLVDEGSRGLAPEQIPSLTWAGEKLQTKWMEAFIAGQIANKPRTWLKGRMPSFPKYARPLAEGLAAQHGMEINDAPFSPDDKLAEIGHRLTLKQGGLDCRQCHGLGKDEPRTDQGANVAPAINFSYVSKRLRHDYYSRLVLDPPRYDSTSRMPRFAPDNRTTAVKEIFDGNAQQQFEAIWHYLKQSGRD